jgi:hypothetical protein
MAISGGFTGCGNTASSKGATIRPASRCGSEATRPLEGQLEADAGEHQDPYHPGATCAPVTVDLRCDPVRIEGGRVFLQLAE